MKKGLALSVSDAFTRFLSDERLGLEKWSLELAEAVRLVHDVCVVAKRGRGETLACMCAFYGVHLLFSAFPCALRCVHVQAGGVAVLAHPSTVKLAPADLEQELMALLSHSPLTGLECYSSRHTSEQAALYVAMAQRLGLIATGGSDYHGTYKPDVRLGVFAVSGSEDRGWRKGWAESVSSLQRVISKRLSGQDQMRFSAAVWRSVLQTSRSLALMI